MESMVVRAGILSISTRAYHGIYADESSPLIARIVQDGTDWEIAATALLPDEADRITSRLTTWADEERLDPILTTGGTGFSPRDMTPEAPTAEVGHTFGSRT